MSQNAVMIPLRQMEMLLQPEPKQLFFAHFAPKGAPNYHFCYSFYSFMLFVDFCLQFHCKSIAVCDLGYVLLTLTKRGAFPLPQRCGSSQTKYKHANLALLTAPNITTRNFKFWLETCFCE
jgi:hypothetical protein